MRKLVTAAFLALALSACALTGSVFGPTPEAQLANGANGHKAATTLGTVLLRNDRITGAQAKSYSTVLRAALGHLDTASADLTACRKKTGTNEKTRPDPCAATVQGDITLAVKIVSDVQQTMKAKE